MPQLRQDRFTKEWVFLATPAESLTLLELIPENGRKPRPHFRNSCSFCVNSDASLPEISRALCPNKPAAKIRVLSQSRLRCQEAAQELLRQEFIVETPDHSLDTALLPEMHYSSLLEILKERFDEIALHPGVTQIIIEKDHLSESVSAEHAHWRLDGFETKSLELDARMRIARQQFAANARCMYCSSLEEELENGSRIVSANRRFVTLEPFASSGPFSTVIYPRSHMAAFSELAQHDLTDLAASMREVFAKFYFGLNDPDYICRLNSSHAPNNYYHWSFSIVPQFSFGANNSQEKLHMNPVLPERAAEFLRAIRVEQAVSA